MSNRRGGSDPSDHLRIAILGAGGFIGSHLVEHLIAEGRHGILGVDVTDEKLSGIASSNFTFLQADIVNALVDPRVRY